METKIEIWRVRGIDGTCFASKLDAEIAARDEFPEEGSGRNYDRIYYLRLNGSPLSLRELGKRAVVVATEDFDVRELLPAPPAEVVIDLSDVYLLSQGRCDE